MGLQVIQSGLECYAVPVKDVEHQNGVSLDKSLTVNYSGGKMTREGNLKNTERTLLLSGMMLLVVKNQTI